jgi:hypothetical protein
MRRRSEQSTPVQPDVQQTLQSFSDETRGRRLQSPRRRKAIRGLAGVALTVAAFGVGHTVRDVIVEGNDHVSSEQAKAKVLQGEKDKRTGFYCQLSRIALHPTTSLSSGAIVSLDVTVGGAEHATLLAPVFYEDTGATGPEQVGIIGAAGDGDGRSMHTVIARIQPQNYDQRIGLYALNNAGESVRCINGFELNTHNDQGQPITPVPSLPGITDLPEQWTQ